MHKNATDKGEISVSEIQHHHHGEIGDKFAKKIAELVTLISKIPAEAVKALKNEENKQSQDVNTANKEAGREDDFENEDCSDLQALENEDAIANIIHGFCMPAGLPWNMVDEIYVLINCDNGFYDKTERIDWPSLEAYKGKITQQIDLINEIPFDVDYVQNIPQQASDSLDCGVFVCAYTKILSEELQVHSYGFDAASQRARYASLLWHYEVEKKNEGYTSDNGDPPRPIKSVIEEIDASAIVTLE
ncbi:hypothetical protein BC332_11901 [Capsicum chinense]|nr:hypothetical protein BC332_11901 [Capsicum chinense]